MKKDASRNGSLLNSILEATADGILVIDLCGDILTANKRFAQMWNIPAGLLASGEDGRLLNYVTAQLKDPGFFIERVEALYNSTETDLDILHFNDGRVFERFSSPLFEKDTLTGRVWSFRDISIKKQQEEILIRSQKMEALGKLTGGIAHDYNNLLAIITGYAAQLTEQLADDPKLAKYSLYIQHAAERGAKLTNRLLAFSRDKITESSALDINSLLQDERHMLEKTLTARIQLVYHLEGGLWPVWLDSGDLEDAIINLSINAMHAMRTGEGKLTICTSNTQISKIDAQSINLQAGEYVLLSITDTGHGMSDAVKEKIFDPFFTTKGEHGTGLGLSQVYGFVERSGGVIKVYSEPEHGSRFAIYFPRSHKSLVQQKPTQYDIDSKSKWEDTVLVVDDEPALAKLAYDILTVQGYQVFTANDYNQALTILNNRAIDVMISDVIMPGRDGYELAAYVAAHYPQTKIQLTSGFVDDRHINRPDSQLSRNMLHKPYTSMSLLQRVRTLLDRTTEDTALSEQFTVDINNS
ncbi:MAG: response regulator [Thiohalomonadales bacterium]